jgi:predicted ATPase/class 3 adenylate cyclase
MFCYLTGLSALSGQIDPEELSEITQAFHSLSDKIIKRHSGRIAQFTPDCLLVYFGYPLAHEDDALRAVRAGRDIVARLRSDGEWLKRSGQVCIAIHTGLALVGKLGDINPDPMAISGEAPKIAARLKSIAAPGQVVLSAATHRLIRGFFACRSLGTPIFTGVASPVEAFEVIAPTGIRTRFEWAVASGLTPFVGRDEEVEQLLDRWRQARGRRGQLVMLSGEPGIGKSRLVRVLAERTAGDSVVQLACGCSSCYRDSALYPVINLLQRTLRFSRDDDADARLTKLEEALAQFGFNLAATVPLFAALLSLPSDQRYPALSLTPEHQKQSTFEYIAEWLMRCAERNPTLLVLEDLHWADPSTLELMGFLIEKLCSASVLLILTFRPEFEPPWPSRPHVGNINVGRLSSTETELMIRSFAGGKQLPSQLANEIIIKADGVPLFVEELTRMVLKSGAVCEQDNRYVLNDSSRPLPIPSTLNDSLMARLDRLGTAKEVAQLAAVIGREFSYDLLSAIAPMEGARLTDALHRLVDAELISQLIFAADPSYSFMHAMIREAAYESLLRSKRRQYHAELARVLEEKFPEIIQSNPELVASHYTSAGLAEMAVPWWLKAGQRALEYSANQEAIRHLRNGLDLVASLPDTAEHRRQKLLLLATLGRG